MKLILTVMMIFSSLTYAAQGDVAVPSAEASQVLELLSKPQNSTAVLLTKTLMDLQSQKDLTLQEPLVLKYSNSQSYSIQFLYKGNGNTEGVAVYVNEVTNVGGAYVFSFHTERLLNIQKLPGVGMGTRMMIK